MSSVKSFWKKKEKKTILFLIKQVETLKALKLDENQQDLKSIKGDFLKEMRNNEIKNEMGEIKKWEEKVKQKDLKYERKNTSIIFSNLKQ